MSRIVLVLAVAVIVWFVRGQIDKRREKEFVDAIKAKAERVRLSKKAKEQLEILREHCARKYNPKEPHRFGLYHDSMSTLLEARFCYGVMRGVLKEIGTTEGEIDGLHSLAVFWKDVALPVHNLGALYPCGSTFVERLQELTCALDKHHKTLMDIGLTENDIIEFRQKSNASEVAGTTALAIRELYKVRDNLRKVWMKKFGLDISGDDLGMSEVLKAIDHLPQPQ